MMEDTDLGDLALADDKDHQQQVLKPCFVLLDDFLLDSLQQLRRGRNFPSTRFLTTSASATSTPADSNHTSSNQNYCSICNQRLIDTSTGWTGSFTTKATANEAAASVDDDELYQTFRKCFGEQEQEGPLSASSLQGNQEITSTFICCPDCAQKLETVRRIQAELDVKLAQLESVRDYLMEIMVKVYLKEEQMLPVRMASTWNEFLDDVALKYLVKDWKLKVEEQTLQSSLERNSHAKKLLNRRHLSAQINSVPSPSTGRRGRRGESERVAKLDEIIEFKTEPFETEFDEFNEQSLFMETSDNEYDGISVREEESNQFSPTWVNPTPPCAIAKAKHRTRSESTHILSSNEPIRRSKSSRNSHTSKYKFRGKSKKAARKLRAGHHECQICKKTFSNAYNLKRHELLRNCHQKLILAKQKRLRTKARPSAVAPSTPCPKCGLLVPQSRSSLGRHRLKCGTAPDSSQPPQPAVVKLGCEYCQEEIHGPDASYWLRVHKFHFHAEKYLVGKPFYCQICFENFDLQSELDLHLIGHKSSQCKICGIQCQSEGGRASHEKAHYKTSTIKTNDEGQSQSQEVEVICCLICQQTFENVALTQLHYAESHELENIKKLEEKKRMKNLFERLEIRSQRSTIEKTMPSGPSRYYRRQSTTTTGANSSIAQEVICEHCGKVCPTRKRYSDHKRCHLKPKLRDDGSGSSGGSTRFSSHTHKFKFKCDYACPDLYFFTSIHQRKHHVYQHPELHLKDKPYYCEVCAEIFAGEELLNEHKKCHDDKAKKYQCDVCGKGYTTCTNLLSHKYNHRPENDGFICGVCGKQYKTPISYQAHLKTHEMESSNNSSGNRKRISKNRAACPYCHKILSGPLSQRIHQLKEHKEQYLANGAVYCHICYKHFLSQPGLDEHILRHEKCQFCERRFSSKYKALQHENSHTGNQPYGCASCGKRFAQESNYYAHLKTHDQQRPHCCQICLPGETGAEGFYRRKHLEQHMAKFHSAAE